jgi:hypothetical protein
MKAEELLGLISRLAEALSSTWWPCLLHWEQEILDFVPQRKTNTRYTAENSLLSAMAFGATVAATHFSLGPDPTGGAMPTYITEGAEGAEEMIQFVREANGDTPVHLLQPQYVYSTDDSTQYSFAGEDKNSNSQWRLWNPDEAGY